MSKVKALEELREIAADINASEIVDHMKLYPSCVFDGAWLDAWHDEFYRAVDRLESEIAERYMELPVDADGVPIRVGDELETSEHGKRFTCTGYSYQTEGYEKPHWSIAYRYDDYDGTTEFVSLRSCRHVKPRTIEDVLREFTEKYQYCISDDGRAIALAKYADELRSMGVGE